VPLVPPPSIVLSLHFRQRGRGKKLSRGVAGELGSRVQFAGLRPLGGISKLISRDRVKTTPVNFIGHFPRVCIKVRGGLESTLPSPQVLSPQVLPFRRQRMAGLTKTALPL